MVYENLVGRISELENDPRRRDTILSADELVGPVLEIYEMTEEILSNPFYNISQRTSAMTMLEQAIIQHTTFGDFKFAHHFADLYGSLLNRTKPNEYTINR